MSRPPTALVVYRGRMCEERSCGNLASRFELRDKRADLVIGFARQPCVVDRLCFVTWPRDSPAAHQHGAREQPLANIVVVRAPPPSTRHKDNGQSLEFGTHLSAPSI